MAIVVAGLALTVVALVTIPKEYTSSVLLEVWHADIQANLIGAEPQNNASTPVILNRGWRRSAKRPSHATILKN